MPLECTAIGAQTWVLRAFVRAQFVHCQIREIPKRPIRGLYPEGVSCRKSSFILKENWEAVKNRSLVHCPDYDFWKSDFTPSKIRENEVLSCGTTIMSTVIQHRKTLRGKWTQFEDFNRKSLPLTGTWQGMNIQQRPSPCQRLNCIEITPGTPGRKYRREDLCYGLLPHFSSSPLPTCY